MAGASGIEREWQLNTRLKQLGLSLALGQLNAIDYKFRLWKTLTI
jgi:hypothetical protein